MTSDATEELNRLFNKKPKSKIVDGGVFVPEAARSQRIIDLEKRVAELERKLK